VLFRSIEINSALVSAQNRRRLYWTNIGLEPQGLFGDLESTIQQPKNKGILLKDVLETEVNEKYYLSGKMLDYLNNRKANYNNGKINYKTGDDVASCITANSGSVDISDNIIVHNTMPRSSTTGKGGTGPLSRADGKTYCLDTGNTNAVQIFNNKRLNETLSNNELVENCLIDSYNQSIHLDKSITILTRVNASSCTHVYKNSRIRRLTPIECERLQTVPDNYTDCVSDSQRYKMIGNGWTVDVIAWIFSFIQK
jgi:DNA (cytosine-5)-methyltransferase 3A